MEQYTRTSINTQLENLGWFLAGPSKNVYQEESRTEKEKKKLAGKRPDYVLYASDRSIPTPLAIIEAKTSAKGLDSAIEQAVTYARILNAPIVFATDGTFYKTKHIKENTSLIYNGEEVNSLEIGRAHV